MKNQQKIIKEFFVLNIIAAAALLVVAVGTSAVLMFIESRDAESEENSDAVAADLMSRTLASGSNSYGIIVINKDHKITHATRSAAEISGYRPSELVGLGISALMAPKVAEDHGKGLRNHFRPKSTTDAAVVVNIEKCSIIRKNREVIEVGLFMMLDPHEAIGVCIILRK